MKLKAKYKKLADGVEAHLEVIDQEDYPSCAVFTDEDGDRYWFIREEFNTVEEAKQWVASEVEKLRRKLEEWRKIEIPPQQEFII